MSASRPPPVAALLTAYAVGAGLLLTFCDWACHVRTGVLVYATDAYGMLPGQPSLQVLVGFLGVGAFCAASGWALFRDLPPPSPRAALASVAAFVASYALSGALQAAPMALYAGFLLTWALHLRAFRSHLHALVGYSVLLGVAGPIAEGTYARTGFFAYTAPAVYGVPVWLTGLYFHGALAVAATVSALVAWSGARGGSPEPADG